MLNDRADKTFDPPGVTVALVLICSPAKCCDEANVRAPVCNAIVRLGPPSVVKVVAPFASRTYPVGQLCTPPSVVVLPRNLTFAPGLTVSVPVDVKSWMNSSVPEPTISDPALFTDAAMLVVPTPAVFLNVPVLLIVAGPKDTENSASSPRASNTPALVNTGCCKV